ncbi:GlcG/HbpS family heme-binding protein [Azohydromonas australica]|uniref:GlcG/HbpS family heme-binding protein n=1 Tax=Azohydromonas australica TaxID=364039 RepID=UPI0004227F1B|nr:heme-binding protein [Azohydromonas australica]
MRVNKNFLMVAAVLALGTSMAHAGCGSLPGWGQLKAALRGAVAAESSGLNLQMWATIVDRDGVVCAVAFSGSDRGAQWPGSRVISAQKANTANAFSLDALALSTANLYSAVQPGGSLFGLQESNPVDTGVAYGGDPEQYGTPSDPMTGRRIGGVNVFGGGLPLYDSNRKVVGAVGVSGDTSCADHMIGWRVRNRLNMDHLAGVGGVSGDAQRPDNIVYDINPSTGKSAGGFGHPLCINTANAKNLPAVE